MATYGEESRLLGVHPNPATSPLSNVAATGNIEAGKVKPHRPVDMNVMKRNMSIAKGFMDISLLTANANQLKHLFIYGDKESSAYYIILTGLILSLILQVATGILLIMKERFDVNREDHQASADLYNNITVFFVFVTLLLNVFISSFGISVKKHGPYSTKQQHTAKSNTAGEGTSFIHSGNTLAEIMTTASSLIIN